MATDKSTPKQPDWEALEADFDRAEGPFDISEVDLEADDVERIDLGTVVITPFPDMKLQMQVNQASEKVQALVVSNEESALEVAVFAAPLRTSMLDEIRQEVIRATQSENGRIAAAKGPFGAELRRKVPVTDSKGNPAMRVSRTWLVQGPGWVVRGVLVGKAATEPNNEAAQLSLFEFFSNLVVNRGSEPAAPGTLLHLNLPQAQE